MQRIQIADEEAKGNLDYHGNFQHHHGKHTPGLVCEYCERKQSELYVDTSDGGKKYCLTCWESYYGTPSDDVEVIKEEKRGTGSPDDGHILSLQFSWKNPKTGVVAVKPMSTSFVGVSPEFSIACYTMVALAGKGKTDKGKEVTKVEIAGMYTFAGIDSLHIRLAHSHLPVHTHHHHLCGFVQVCHWSLIA
jgi:hypothetical protein